MADGWDELGRDPRFYEWWRGEFPRVATLVEVFPEGALYYYDSPYSCTVSVVVGRDFVFVDYLTPGLFPEKARGEILAWMADLQRRTGAPEMAGEMGWSPVYAARSDAASGTVLVGTLRPGDWCGLFMKRGLELPRYWDQLPDGWPESYRERIAELAATRTAA
jgi:hypothetical protein